MWSKGSKMDAANKTMRVGLAGLGNVGMGVVKILEQQAGHLEARTGVSIKLTAISARSRKKDRGIDLSSYDWCDNPVDLASRDDVDVIIEVMGGQDGVALDLIEAALDHGKPVVTANKALLAHHGVELARKAEKASIPLAYEAAVAGGIPIIKMIKEGLAANDIDKLYGIMNGTCNYILTTMEATGQPFAEVLAEAQKLGYAEADPTLDVGGGDSGHKLALLTALAFGCRPDFSSLGLEGIERLSAEDITISGELGYRIKLIGQALRLDDERILQMVAPCLVPKTAPLANVNNVLNGIFMKGNFVGPSFIEGRGAGEGPTASAIVADIIDIARGKTGSVFGMPVDRLAPPPTASRDDWNGEFYIRLVVDDRPGVIADIAPILRDHSISIASLIQRGCSAEEPVSVVILTHKTSGKAIREASSRIAALGTVRETPLTLPILTL